MKLPPMNSLRLLAGLSAALLGAVALTVPAGRTEAATATGTVAITATVQATCVMSATPLSFGVYTGVALTGTSTITMTCSNTTPYSVGISAGAASGATVTTRAMTSGAVTLAYALYSNTTRTLNWGTTTGTDTVAGTGTGVAQPLTVYGSVAAGQFITPGSYTDTVTATVTY